MRVLVLPFDSLELSDGLLRHVLWVCAVDLIMSFDRCQDRIDADYLDRIGVGRAFDCEPVLGADRLVAIVGWADDWT